MKKEAAAISAVAEKIDTSTQNLRNATGDLKKETGSLPDRLTTLGSATDRLTKAVDQLAAGNQKVTDLIGKLESSTASATRAQVQAEIAQGEAASARAAEKGMREQVVRLETEARRLTQRLESDLSAAILPTLSKLEDELKKALRNFSGSTRDRTGVTSPLLALLISHCLYLLALAAKNNDTLLQSAMRSNLSRIAEKGSERNLLGFTQARATLQNAGWLTAKLSEDQMSSDPDLKDASWFQTALKCIRDREALELGPFYVGIDSKGKVQFVN